MWTGTARGDRGGMIPLDRRVRVNANEETPRSLQ